MLARFLFQGGPRVSALGFGAWPLSGKMGPLAEDQAIATVHAALDHGITLIDTAEYYGVSEEILGRALAGRRSQVILATKVSFPPFTPERVRAALDRSLRALRTDCIDLYQLHSYDASTPLEVTLEALLREQEKGRIRWIGVSNFTAEQHRQAFRLARIATSQPAYNLLQREVEREILDLCAANGTGVLAHSPLAKGLLTGKYRPGHTFDPADERASMPAFQGEAFAAALRRVDRLRPIAQELGLTLVQLALAWVLRHRAVACVLVGAKSPDQVAEQAQAAALTLPAWADRAIDEALSAQP